MTTTDLLEAAAKVCEGFDQGVFVRAARDEDPAWAIKLFPYLRALGVLAAAVEERHDTEIRAAEERHMDRTYRPAVTVIQDGRDFKDESTGGLIYRADATDPAEARDEFIAWADREMPGRVVWGSVPGPPTPPQSRTLFRALAMQVLCVATTRHDGWAAYCDSVPGFDHSVEFGGVLKHGDKMPEPVALALFPEFAGVPYAD